LPLGGGGTDLPEFYSKHGGFWISAAIDKFVYVAINSRFESKIRLAYSKIEVVDELDDIKHNFIRVALEHFNVRDHVDITTLSDLPSGSGMGSSCSFAVGLINALSVYTRTPVVNIAELAFDLDRSLGHPVGKQDQYTALYGGTRVYTVDKFGNVTNRVLSVTGLEDHLSLFYTNLTRDANPILTKVGKDEDNMLKIMEIGEQSFDALDTKQYDLFGSLLDTHWKFKRMITPEMTNTEIDRAYDTAIRSGALGGKIIGAGGGGFLLFYTRSALEKAKLIKAMADINLPHVPFRFYPEGSRVIET
jgi:D-glycero-alpha-D-manno-heptose-7-phosphate kinase